MAIPRPNIIAIMEDPPYDSIGSGAPTIGIKPNTIPILTATYKKKAVAKLKQYNFPKTSLVRLPIETSLQVIVI